MLIYPCQDPLTMRIRKDLNYSKYGVRFKLVAVAFVIYVVWDVDSGIFKLLHGLFLRDDGVHRHRR